MAVRRRQLTLEILATPVLCWRPCTGPKLRLAILRRRPPSFSPQQSPAPSIKFPAIQDRAEPEVRMHRPLEAPEQFV
jgi:hypothetical protein